MNDEQHSPQEDKDIRFKTPTFIDPLTGLFNQYYLFEFLPEELKKAKLGNYSIAVLMVDLDGFKEINDTYGHLSGDEVLKQLAGIIKKSVRQTDMAIRYAGDEFAILLPAADMKWAEVLSKKLIENVEKYVFQGKEGEVIHLTLSIGFAVFPHDSEKMNELIDLADKALYLSKKKGKNRVSHAKDVSLGEISNIVAMDSFPCPKFIDRKDAIERLKHIFDTVVVKSHLLQVAFISGGSGVGKTRLLNELKKYIRDQGALISHYSSSAHMQDPYYLFAKGITSYIEKVGIENAQLKNIFSQLPPTELEQLSRVVPPIANLLKQPVGLELEDKKARFLLFKAFLDFLIELNKDQAILITFDDIHWADKGSIELLRYLSKQEKNKKIFIACSFSERNENINELLEDISFNDNFSQIELAGFSLEDTADMIKAIFPGLEIGKEFYELICSTTQGNPSFIEEILKSLVENTVIFYQDERWQIKKDLSNRDIPVSLDEVVRKRLKNLDEETKEMIVQAAVIGDNFSSDVLRKVGDKNEGFILELLERAKKMRLIDELDTKGKFHFVNKNVQNALYHNELDEDQRKKLHYKIGQVIAEEHKDNLDNAAGELEFHFSKVPQREEDEYTKTLLKKINQMFIPTEAMEYLENLAKEADSKGEAIIPLSEDMLKEAVKFIGIFQKAIKNFNLYPPGTMRDNALQEVYSVLNAILKESKCLNLAEVEKILVINGRRMVSKGADQSTIGYFLDLMIEHNLKALSFTEELSRQDLDKFIQCLNRPAEEINANGGWMQVINKEEIKGIKIDDVRFIQLDSLKEKFGDGKKIEKAKIMEFLLGNLGHSGVDRDELIRNMQKDPKKLAQTIVEVSSELLKEGKADDETKVIINSIEKISSQILGPGPENKERIKDLAKVILELKPEFRNKVLRSQYIDRASVKKEEQTDVFNSIPDEVIVDMIIEEYKENGENLLALKDFVSKILIDTQRKDNILLKLEESLLKYNLPKQEISFITGGVKWEDLTLESRINNIIKLPDKYFESESEKAKSLLAELDSKQSLQELDNFLFHLIAKAGKLSPQKRVDLLNIIAGFIKISGKEDSLQMEEKLDGLLKKLNIELNPDVFASILHIFRGIVKDFTARMQAAKNVILEIDKPEAKGHILFIHQLFYILFNRLKWERDRNPQIYKLIDEFIRDISSEDFLEILVYVVTNSYFQEKIDLRDLFPIVGDRLIDAIIKIENAKVITSIDSFREYVIRREIINLLQKLGEPALNRLQQKLAVMKQDMPLPLIELIGYLNNPGWVNLLLPFIKHADPLVRRTAAVSISAIGGGEAKNALAAMLKAEKDKKLRVLIKKLLEELK